MEKYNPKLIRNILTLRYDPSQKSLLQPLTWNDFVPKEIHDVESKVLKIFQNNLMKEQQRLNLKKISISLSGGVDSGLTLAMIRRFLPDVKIQCVSMGFGNKDDEVQRARELSTLYDCDFVEIIKDDILNELPKLIKIVQEPRWNLYNFYTFEQGKKYSDVFFTGDGGDELFGGYTFRLDKFLSSITQKDDWKKRVQTYLNCHERDWVPDQDKMFGSKIKFSWEEIYSIFKPYFDNKLSPINQVFLSDFNGKLLYDWIPTNKAFETFCKIEIKSILLNQEMINFATHIPWRKKFDPAKKLGKLPLRAILSKQKGFEKEEMLKKGFSTNLVELWHKNAKEIINHFVNEDSRIVKNEIIDSAWLKNTKKSLNESSEPEPRYINKMLSLLALEIWYRLFISKDMKENVKI